MPTDDKRRREPVLTMEVLQRAFEEAMNHGLGPGVAYAYSDEQYAAMKPWADKHGIELYRALTEDDL